MLRHSFRRTVVACSALAFSACGGAPGGGVVGLGPSPAGAQDGSERVWADTMETPRIGTLPPIGYGTLSQDNITVLLASGPVQIKVVPLEEWVIRMTAPDTYRRLHAFKTSRDSEILDATDRRGEPGWPLVLLVTFFTREQEEIYEPFDLQIQSQGVIYRPLEILPISQDFGRGRLNQELARIALYLFSADIDLNLPMSVLYQKGGSPRWGSLRTRLDRERSLVLSRSGAVQAKEGEEEDQDRSPTPEAVTE